MGLPTILWGAPGIAKTSRIEAATYTRGLHLETVILSLRDPSDVAGLPIVQPNGGVALEPPSWARALAAAPLGQGVLFFDELSCAAPSVQAAALRVIAEGVVGQFALPKGVRIIAAANPEDQAAGGWGLSAPMANRFIHIDFDAPSAEEWSSWLVGDGRPSDEKPTEMDAASWDRAWARERGIFGSFIRKNAGRLLELPDGEAARGKAWPSPRSWELAARATAGARALGAGDGLVLRLIIGAVGEGAANEAMAYFRTLDLPEPEDVLAGRAQVPMARPDQTYASLAGVCAIATTQNPHRLERIVRALEVAAAVAMKHSDVAAACLKSVCRSEELKPAFQSPHLSGRVVKALTGPLKDIAQYLQVA